MKFHALVLFCGGGGACEGLTQAGFSVVGVDINPQPHYKHRFFRADALTIDFAGFDFIWASPPCQRYSTATRDKSIHPDLIGKTRQKLMASGVPWVIENVIGAPLIDPIMLCGEMFGLSVIRHRIFETSFWVRQPKHPKHQGSIVTGEYVTVVGGGSVPRWTATERLKRGLPKYLPREMRIKTWQDAMGIDWLPRKPLTQAVPPAYAKWIGDRAMEHLKKKFGYD